MGELYLLRGLEKCDNDLVCGFVNCQYIVEFDPDKNEDIKTIYQKVEEKCKKHVRNFYCRKVNELTGGKRQGLALDIRIEILEEVFGKDRIIR